jgi:GNAT superfamily N-acetyltransferase
LSTDIAIRPPGEAEWTAIANLLRVCFADEGPEVGGTIDTAESVAALQQSGKHLLVMEVGDRIIGFVYLDPKRKGAFRLAVDPGFRGMDYGRQLMEAAEAKARTFGWERLLLGVRDTKQTLVPYYHRLGYADTGERYEMEAHPGYGGPKHYFIILSKRLTAGEGEHQK